MNGLNWYKEVSKFLTELNCYLTTPNMDENIANNLLKFARSESCSIFRVNTEYKKYGLYVSRGNHGNSMIITKDAVERFCENKDYSVDGLLNTNQIIDYSFRDFRDCRHRKNQNKKEQKELSRRIKIRKRKDILNNPLSTPEAKKHVLLDIWSDCKLEKNEIATTEYENLLFSKLYALYHKRVKKQQKFIIRNRVYFVDIYMRAYKVAIEVDGGYHNTKEQAEKDKQKDLDLSTKGLLVIRIRNEDIKRRFKMLTKILDSRHNDIIKGVVVPTGTFKL
jgi:very-short-patch-repair endonuclease